MIRSILAKFPREFSEFLDFHRTRFFKGSRYALNDLDVKLQKYLSKKNGYFVELGANNGFKQSNTLFLENKFGWSGLLIEPSPENFLKCVYYRGHRNTVMCCACVPCSYPDDHVWFEDAGLMTVAPALDTDHFDVLEFVSEGRDLLSYRGGRNLRYAVEARTLTDCLDEAGAPTHVDFLSLDVEGAELSVLQGIDFTKYIFYHIMVECRDIERMNIFLTERGYHLVERLSHHDYLFKFNGDH